MIITKEWIEKEGACSEGAEWGIKTVGDGMEFSKILPKFDRADWLLWTLRRVSKLEKVQWVKLAVICAETVLKIYEKKYPKGNRPRKAIEAAVAYAKNPTEENRKAAAYAAYAASDAAYAASDAAYADAVYAASTAAYAASTAAYAAYAASDASDASDADYADAVYAAYAYADDAAAASGGGARKKHHKRMCDLIREFLKKEDIDD